MAKQLRVLVVDDSSLNREIIRDILGDEYLLIEAVDGESALQAVVRYHPRIVLLDIMLPGMDGYELCRRLRSMPSMSNSRIIMISAKAMPSERARGFEAGADVYICKPFDDAELIAAIRPKGWSKMAVALQEGSGAFYESEV